MKNFWRLKGIQVSGGAEFHGIRHDGSNDEDRSVAEIDMNALKGKGATFFVLRLDGKCIDQDHIKDILKRNGGIYHLQPGNVMFIKVDRKKLRIFNILAPDQMPAVVFDHDPDRNVRDEMMDMLRAARTRFRENSPGNNKPPIKPVHNVRTTTKRGPTRGMQPPQWKGIIRGAIESGGKMFPT
jgi:hypothetical protein